MRFSEDTRVELFNEAKSISNEVTSIKAPAQGVAGLFQNPFELHEEDLADFDNQVELLKNALTNRYNVLIKKIDTIKERAHNEIER